MAPITSYTLITRTTTPQTGLIYQNVPEVCPPMNPDRNSPYQFIQRLKDFPPSLSDVLVVASTASADIGLITRSKSPLTSEVSSEQITNMFATTSMADDSRRAQLPMAENTMEGSLDTSPIGLAVDLSSKENVGRPLPKEEFDHSPSPLPGLMVLNNEGFLTSWWLVYADSIRQGTTYPGLTVVSGTQPEQTSQNQRQASPLAPTSSSAPPNAPAFGQTAFGQAAPAFGGNTSGPAATFGAANTPGRAFGSSSTMGKQSLPWGSPIQNTTNASALGQPAFGSSTPMGAQSQGSAFGVSGGLGNRSSPWGAPSAGTQGAPGSVFGQASGLNARPSPFSNAASNNTAAPSAGGFASFASSASGFAASGKPSGGSIFGQPSSTSAFTSSSTSTPLTSFSNNASSFGQPPKQDVATKSAFGSGNFSLGSTFKADGSATNDGLKPTGDAGNSMFGSGFGDTLGQTQTEVPQSKDADMEDDADDGGSKDEQPSFRPVSAGAIVEPSTQVTPQTTQTQESATPVKSPDNVFVNSQGGENAAGGTTPKHARPNLKDLQSVQTTPKVKTEPDSSEDGISPLKEEEKQFPEGYHNEAQTQNLQAADSQSPKASTSASSEPPLPPESTSKTTFAPGDSSSSSKSSAEEPPTSTPGEPPLPPDPFPTKTKLNVVQNAPPEDSKLPEEGNDGEETDVEDENEEDEAEGQDGEEGEGDDRDPRIKQESFDDEGSGVDVAQEISSPSDQNQSPKISPESSFGMPKSPAESPFSKTRQKEATPKERPLFGEVGKTSVPFFPPPSKTQQSPRSPSPVRQISQLTSDSLRPDNSRSVSAPGPFNSIVNQKIASNQIVPQPREHLPSAAELRKQEEQRILIERARRIAEEEQDLSEDEDEQITRALSAPVPAVRSLDPFLAHQDYIGKIDKTGIPGQIEKVYRDINSMIDTLGLNARSLAAFVKGHSESTRGGERNLDDLEHSEDWCLEELPNLRNLETQLSNSLERLSFSNVHAILSSCNDIRHDLAKLRNKRRDRTKTIEGCRGPHQNGGTPSAPLSLEQVSQQQTIRKLFMQFQKQLGTAEEKLTVLRAELTSCDSPPQSNIRPLSAGSSFSASSRQREGPMKKPTLEAVTKTILKMTSMVEKKISEIDVLESQIRHLRLSHARGSRPGSRGSREASPLLQLSPSASMSLSIRPKNQVAQPIQKKSPLRNSIQGSQVTGSLKNGARGSFATPVSDTEDEYEADSDDDDEDDDKDQRREDDEVQRLKERMKRRAEVNRLIREVFEREGPRIRGLD